MLLKAQLPGWKEWLPCLPWPHTMSGPCICPAAHAGLPPDTTAFQPPCLPCSLLPLLPLQLGKAIRMHHMLHHTRNEAYWLAFIVPQVGGRHEWGRSREQPAQMHLGCCASRCLARVCRGRSSMNQSSPPSQQAAAHCPPTQVDALFGTAPQPGSVRMSEMAKQGLKASREAAAASSSSAGTSS